MAFSVRDRVMDGVYVLMGNVYIAGAILWHASAVTEDRRTEKIMGALATFLFVAPLLAGIGISLLY